MEVSVKELLSFLRTGFLISKICLPANFELNSGFIVEKKIAFQTLWSIICEVPLVVEVARPTERSLFGETTQFVPVSSANKKPTDHNSLFLLFNFMKKGYSTAVEYLENF